MNGGGIRLFGYIGNSNGKTADEVAAEDKRGVTANSTSTRGL